MKSLRLFSVLTLLGCLTFSHLASAAIDSAAPVVLLRTSCNDGTGGTLNNCFTSTSDVVNWIVNTRQPTASSRLAVEIGPGTFGAFDLSAAGGCWLSLHGAGRQHTTIEGQYSAMDLTNSCNLDVSNLTIKCVPCFQTIGVGNNGNNTGVTTWTDVDVIGSAYGWSELACDINQPHPKHYWFNSRIITSTGFGPFTRSYNAQCGEHWFFASEITAVKTASTGGTFALSTNGADVHVYGGVIRMIIESGVSFTGAAIVAQSTTIPSSLAELHIHGTGIDVISKGSNNITVFSIGSQAKLHANGAAYNLQTPSGTITRISNQGGHVHAPYLWEEHATPPNIISVTGADMAVVTDGPQPHLVIYSSNCTSKWFDTSTNACRP
jgi:hypothetical protein